MSGWRKRTIMEMARETGLLDSRDDWSSVPEEYMECITDFAKLVREDEREACAKVCESFQQDPYEELLYKSDFAAAIRARGNT